MAGPPDSARPKWCQAPFPVVGENTVVPAPLRGADADDTAFWGAARGPAGGQAGVGAAGGAIRHGARARPRRYRVGNTAARGRAPGPGHGVPRAAGERATRGIRTGSWRRSRATSRGSRPRSRDSATCSGRFGGRSAGRAHRAARLLTGGLPRPRVRGAQPAALRRARRLERRSHRAAGHRVAPRPGRSTAPRCSSGAATWTRTSPRRVSRNPPRCSGTSAAT